MATEQIAVRLSDELPLGPDDGMPTGCAASFDNLRIAPKAYLGIPGA